MMLNEAQLNKLGFVKDEDNRLTYELALFFIDYNEKDNSLELYNKQGEYIQDLTITSKAEFNTFIKILQ